MRIVRGLAVLTATTVTTSVVLAATVAGAGAESQVRQDPRGDTTTFAARGAAQSADILRFQGVHRDGRLKFRFTVADLTLTDGFDSAVVRFRTPTDRTYRLTVARVPGDKDVRLEESTTEGGLQPVECRGLVGRFLPASDQIVLAAPRSCVFNPRSVRFGGATAAVSQSGEEARGYADDARRVGQDGSGESVRLGTRDLFHNARP